MQGNIHAKLLKYVIDQGLLHNKELQQRLLLLKNEVMLGKHFLKKPSGKQKVRMVLLALGKISEIVSFNNYIHW